MLNDYALIIGVESYRAFDATGGSDVAGAVNDARALTRQCLAMGFAPERIHVLTSPKIAAAAVGPEAEGIHFAEATREQIAAGLAWIDGALADAAPSAGLCTFSGHGLMDRGLVLCPADFDGRADSLVRVSEVRRAFGHGRAADNLTVLLDCCHAQGDTAKGVAGHLAALAAELGVGETHERLLAACGKDQTSVASTFGGVKLGAFTWAVTSAMGQWKAAEEQGVARLDASYGELLSRTKALLAALSFEQVPVLSGPAGVEEIPFMHPGRRDGDATAKDPDAVRPDRQISPDQYTLVITYTDVTGGRTTTYLGEIYATGTTGITLTGLATTAPNMEYWFLDQTALAKLASATSSNPVEITFTPHALVPNRAYTPPDVPYVRFTETPVTWTSQGPMLGVSGTQQSYVLGGTAADGTTTYLQLVIQPSRGIAALRGVTWAYFGRATPSTITPTGAFTTNAALPAGSYWSVSNRAGS
ncbi:Hypothetical protein A7982_03810 [Minicystis rosea]|nr:Hypothetical protein A7982_03810 [Minicystis rosea]